MSLDVDRVVGAIRKAQDALGASSELAEALLPALNVSYVLLDGHGQNFEDYLAAFTGISLPSLGSFSSREEFDAWLKTHSEPPPSGSLRIARERYTLGYSRASGEPLLLLLPRIEDLWRPGGEEGRERLWRALDEAHSALSSSPDDLEGLHSAALALHFIREAGCTRDFARFLAHLDEPLPLLCSFATREEAESWLRKHPRPPHGASVQVGGEMLTVGYQRERDQRLLVCFPKNEE
ncbi:hypothetical protein BON30_29470 [Cystobacter ferrugineus]|uniref:Uncharacterized protein n=1 Tax=Cystobacter ferrugineus TaxID=83449 RepID=A0A1L9B5B1_9BACT|nr:hypothetical protein BON30_29470 [Cystobacter ferrugineus]